MSNLAFHIRQFAPDAQGEELEHRTALLKARDYAAWLCGTSSSLDALDHAVLAHEIAGRFVYADVPAVRLKLAVTYCRHLVQCAFLADHLDYEEAGR